MANPLAYTPKPVNPKLELQRRLDAAPAEHGEAMLVAWDLLQKAHDEGLLDLIHGLVGAKDVIAGKLAEYAKLPEGVSAIRNLIPTSCSLAPRPSTPPASSTTRKRRPRASSPSPGALPAKIAAAVSPS